MQNRKSVSFLKTILVSWVTNVARAKVMINQLFKRKNQSRLRIQKSKCMKTYQLVGYYARYEDDSSDDEDDIHMQINPETFED